MQGCNSGDLVHRRSPLNGLGSDESTSEEVGVEDIQCGMQSSSRWHAVDERIAGGLFDERALKTLAVNSGSRPLEMFFC